MDNAVLYKRLCQVELRRLLVIIGVVVAVIVAFQCFALPHGRTSSLLLAHEDSTVMIAGNATLLGSSEATNIYAVSLLSNGTHIFDMEEAADYEDKASETHTEYYVASEKNLQNVISFHKAAAPGPGLAMESKIDKSSTQVKAIDIGHGPLEHVHKAESMYKIDDGLKATTGLTSGGSESKRDMVSVVSQGISVKTGENLDADARIFDPILSANESSEGNAKHIMDIQLKSAELLKPTSIILNNESTTVATKSVLKRWEMRPTTISQMNSILLQSHISSHPVWPQWSSARDHELLSAKLQIENAPIISNNPGLYAPVFRNVSVFKRSYELMERMLKVHIYKEGEKPVFHNSQMRGIYASEGWFMKLMEGNRKFTVKDPRKAHLFYLPFSSLMLRTFGNYHSQKELVKLLDNYVNLIAGKYRFWNRTGGADHFLVACHDWASRLTKQRLGNCIRALCNANVARGFKIGKDTSLPVTYIRSMEAPLKDLGGNTPSERPILAFFAGGMHGYLRPVLLQYWENKEADMKIFGPMPRDPEGKRIYRKHMKTSKYCICARGYEVHTPRVVEAIFYECVPVIISDNYVPPFFEVLNWETFAVFVQEKDIPKLRNILLSIPEEKYLALQLGVKKVQQHFFWHKRPLKYDLFHMILHSVWYNRVFQTKG